MTTLANSPRLLVTHLIESIYRSSGSPDAQQKWSNPDLWVDVILEGEERNLAKRIWRESGGSINPRYIKGPHLFLNKQKLIDLDLAGKYQISVRGNLFLFEEKSTVAEVDRSEGLLEILRILQTGAQAREILLQAWRHFAIANSAYRAESSIQTTLSDRLKNLLDRGLIARDRSVNSMTEQGCAYLDAVRRIES